MLFVGTEFGSKSDAVCRSYKNVYTGVLFSRHTVDPHTLLLEISFEPCYHQTYVISSCVMSAVVINEYNDDNLL